MMSPYQTLQAELRTSPRAWLVTGVGGFIGSNLLERLLRLDQRVVGMDNFATGHRRNLVEVQTLVSAEQWSRFKFIEGDIRSLEDCRKACAGMDFVLHQAALGSVPRSIEDPLASHAANVSGFLNILVAARDAKVRRFVYASSSSVYGDSPTLPKVEGAIGRPLSPYAATKLMDEIHAEVFSRCYGISVVGLRYFNVFGPRQDPNGAYAAVIPRWFAAVLAGNPVVINGDGETSRDFCYIANVVQANLLAAAGGHGSKNDRAPISVPDASVFNVACGERTTLLQLFEQIRNQVSRLQPGLKETPPSFQPERAGDVRHSLANITAARERLGYEPTHSLQSGLAEAANWYAKGKNADS